MDAGQYQHATELAEKFEDFCVLVQLCEDTGNRGKLAEYMQQYKAQVISSIVVLIDLLFIDSSFISILCLLPGILRVSFQMVS